MKDDRAYLQHIRDAIQQVRSYTDMVERELPKLLQVVEEFLSHLPSA